MLQAGERVGPLRIERPLGVGGMGEVYLARDERLERHVAVKLLSSSRSLDPEARGRMLREARAASALKHANIVTVYDVGEHEGLAYIVMEYVDGETFAARVRRTGALPPADALALVAEAADAVAAAHAAGVLHRDIKSANLMIDAEGGVKVLDFGLSKRTTVGKRTPAVQALSAEVATVTSRGETDEVIREEFIAPAPSAPASEGSRSDEPLTVEGTRMGTPGWAAPELIDGGEADVRTDVFALACVLYHLLAGEPPFQGETWTELRAQIDHGPRPPSRLAAAVPAALEAVVLAGLAANPAQRPQTPHALIAAARASIASRPVPPGRRRWIAPLAIGAIGIALVAFVVGRPGDPKPKLAIAAASREPAPAPPPVPVAFTRLGGCAYSPIFLDDDTVVFDLTRDEKVDLYRLDLDATDPVQVTSDAGWEWQVSRGRNEHEVAFLWSKDNNAGTDTFDLATRTRHPLVGNSGPVLFARDAYLHAPAKSSTLRRLHDGRDDVILTMPDGLDIQTMAVAPDDNRIAVMLRSPRSPFQLCTIELDQPALRCSKAEPRGARPAFSSTSAAVYFDTHAGIERLVLDDSKIEPVIPGVVAQGGIAVSPSGGALVYSDCRGVVQLLSPLDDPQRPAVAEPIADAPALGPGGLIAYVRPRGRGTTLAIRRPDGRIHEQVTYEAGRISGLAFSRDGSSIAYVLGAATEAGIYVAQVGVHVPPNRLTEHASDSAPVFAGDRIYFTRWSADGAPQLVQVSRDGSDERVVAHRPRITIDAAPDGRILVAAPARNFIYWWDPATGKETRGPAVPGGMVAADFALSPDGRWLVVLAGNNGQMVWRVATDKPDAKPELAHQLPYDATALVGAIDDRGHPLVAVSSWVGELWLVKPPAGSTW